MKLTGYSREWNHEEGLQSIEVQDLQIQGTQEELQQMADYILECSKKLSAGHSELPGIELEDSRPNPKTGISIYVLSNK